MNYHITSNNGLPLFESHHLNQYQLKQIKTYDDIIWIKYKKEKQE